MPVKSSHWHRALALRPSRTSLPTSNQRRKYISSTSTLTKPRFRSFTTANRCRPPGPRAQIKRYASIDPSILLVAAAASAGVGYILSISLSSRSMAVPPVAQAGPTTSMPDKLDAVSLHAHLLESVKDLPSGRPGNMTAEQEASLKEMWIKLLDIFGVRKASTDASTAADAAPGRKEKKASGGRSGFSFWGGSKEAATDDANGAEGDKHGVNKAYREALDTMSPEQLRDEFWKMVKSDAPDAAVLRFLSARKWDPQAGVAMLISALRWRAVDMQVDDVLLVEGEAGALKQAKDSSDEGRKKESEDFMAQLRMGKSFLHAVDKQGRPCNYVRVRLHKGGEQSASSIEKFTVFLIETARLTAAPGADTAVSLLPYS